MTATVNSAPQATSRPRAAARRSGFRAYRAEISRLVATARESSRRFQRQWIILFAAGVFALAAIAGLYLNVTANAAIAGREIQNIEAEITVNERANADLQTNIAMLLSNQVLEDRALALGFKPVAQDDLDYMVVPGYFPSQGVTLVAPVTEVKTIRETPEFNETLIDWFKQELEAASLPLAQIRR